MIDIWFYTAHKLESWHEGTGEWLQGTLASSKVEFSSEKIECNRYAVKPQCQEVPNRIGGFDTTDAHGPLQMQLVNGRFCCKEILPRCYPLPTKEIGFNWFDCLCAGPLATSCGE